MATVNEHWEAVPLDGGWFLALMGEGKVVIRVHPIGFDTETEAVRAAARVNKEKS